MLMILEVKIFTKKILMSGRKIVLKDIRRGKYFRIIAVVLVDNKNLVGELLQTKLAKPYFGGKRPNW